jgi:hypothetical protein
VGGRRGPADRADVAAQVAGLGLPAALAARLAPPAPPEVIEVWPENWDAMRIFLGLETQWRRAGMAGVPVGLDYAALPVVATALGVPLLEDLLARLRILEGAALTAMAEKAR